MSRPLFGRVLSLALTLWLSLFMSESELIVRCPTHGGGSHSASEARGAIAADQTEGHNHAAGHSSPANQDAGHSCSCPGPGCCPPAVAVVPSSSVPLAHIVAVHEASATSALERFADASEYLHPPATAPPAVALAPSV